jgi:hypothetical protein
MMPELTTTESSLFGLAKSSVIQKESEPHGFGPSNSHPDRAIHEAGECGEEGFREL